MCNVVFRAVAICFLAWAQALASRPANATDVVLPGSYHTTVDKQGIAAANNYNDPNASVTVHYNIVIKVDPATQKKVFDLANSTVSFEYLFNKTPFKTVNVPITSVTGDATTGAVTSFKFAGTQWDPNRPAQNNGISGEVNVTGKTGTIKSGYTSGGRNPTLTSYTFATQNEKPAAPKVDGKTGKPFSAGSSIPADKSIGFDATTGLLSIKGDSVTSTPAQSDPILGASVSLADYQFTGITSDGALAAFWPTGADALTVSNGYLGSEMPVLFYDVPDNLFYAALSDLTLAGVSASSPFYNPRLSSVSSPFLASLDDVLNPLSPQYDPSASLFTTIEPTADFNRLTAGFTQTASSGATDAMFVADPIPEPPTVAILGAGLAGLVLLRRRRTRS